MCQRTCVKIDLGFPFLISFHIRTLLKLGIIVISITLKKLSTLILDGNALLENLIYWVQVAGKWWLFGSKFWKFWKILKIHFKALEIISDNFGENFEIFVNSKFWKFWVIFVKILWCARAPSLRVLRAETRLTVYRAGSYGSSTKMLLLRQNLFMTLTIFWKKICETFTPSFILLHFQVSTLQHVFTISLWKWLFCNMLWPAHL